MADLSSDRRRERRLRYHWPVWFTEDMSGALTQGQMVDVSSGGAAFTCYADKCPRQGQKITARFSVPRYGEDDSFDLENYVRSSTVCRTEEISPFIHKVAVQFAQTLPFKPGEVTDSEALEIDEGFMNDNQAGHSSEMMMTI